MIDIILIDSNVEEILLKNGDIKNMKYLLLIYYVNNTSYSINIHIVSMFRYRGICP